MLDEINKYFRTRVGHFENFEKFKKTGLYDFYASVFGPLVYVEDCSRQFIGVDCDGNFYDDIYYPYRDVVRIGTVIPKIFYESDLPPTIPSKEWEEVANKGYCVLNKITSSDELSKRALNEGFIPYGINPELNMSPSVSHAYFATNANYDAPESHKEPDYMTEITSNYIQQLPTGNFHIYGHKLHTADIVKYIYDEKDMLSKHGPFSFHMDYFSRLHFMFFSYFSKKSPIVGRELLVGFREDFLDFSKEALDLSYDKQEFIVSPFEKVDDSRVTNHDKIAIDNNTIILMNTLNPMMVHKVNKLREKNEVVLITNYLWSESWPSDN